MSDENEQNEQNEQNEGPNINYPYFLEENKVYNIFFNYNPEDPEKYIYGGWELDASNNKMWSVVFFEYNGIKNTQKASPAGIKNMSLIIPVSYFYMDFTKNNKDQPISKINLSYEQLDDEIKDKIKEKIQKYMTEIYKTKTSEIAGGNPYSKLKRRKGRKTKKSRKSRKSRKNRK
jgi:hypothetical protein